MMRMGLAGQAWAEATTGETANATATAVTNWRRRPNTAAGMLPFPPPLSADGVERFAADEVVAWLEKTGRGRNAEARADAPAFSLREGFSLDEVVTMLALRSMCDCDLTALSAADLAAVQAEVIDTIKADKVITYVKRRRKHSSQRTRGHRQQLTLVRITDLLEKGGDKTDVKAAVGARTKVEAPAKPAKAKKAKAEASAEAASE